MHLGENEEFAMAMQVMDSYHLALTVISLLTYVVFKFLLIGNLI
jgi:hypothetical protein